MLSRKSSAVIIDILPQQKNFTGSIFDGTTRFRHNQISRDRYLITACFRDDTKGTLLITTDRDVDVGFIRAASEIFERKLGLIIVDLNLNRFVFVDNLPD